MLLGSGMLAAITACGLPQTAARCRAARPWYQARPAGRVLTVTTGEKRAANLKAITEREGGKGKFWFTTLAQVTPETVLTMPIWQKAGSDELHSLIW